MNTAALALSIAATAFPSGDVRVTSDYSALVWPGRRITLPARVCRGFLPSDREAYFMGRRVGDDLLKGPGKRRMIRSGYRVPVRVYVWCEED